VHVITFDSLIHEKKREEFNVLFHLATEYYNIIGLYISATRNVILGAHHINYWPLTDGDLSTHFY
jgi:hypothetical protein